MDNNTKASIEIVAISTAVTVSVVSALYFIVVIWWSGMVSGWHEEEMARHETCYQKWAYSEAHRRHYVTVDYCGEKKEIKHKEGEDNDGQIPLQ